MVFCISMKFHENIFMGFQDIGWTGNYHSLILKGNCSKNVQTRVSVVCTLCDDISINFNENILNAFQGIE